ncbi:hypothetical protein Golob_014238, partial [Gossypium lobatum]|nr:hypothetical protein [Gossypium lobatum]
MHRSNLNPFSLNASEFTDIMKDFDEPGHLAPKGLHLAVAKYMVIQGEPGIVPEVPLLDFNFGFLSLDFTESSQRIHRGTGGVTIKKTGQALILGIYEEPVTPGQCNMVVERLGDYLA